MLIGEQGYLAHPKPASFRTAVERAEKGLKGHIREFDSIFVTGLSGVTVGSVIAHKYKKKLVILRKQDENAHGTSIEGELTVRYIIIDDFIATGATMLRLINAAGGLLPCFVVLYGGNKEREVYDKTRIYQPNTARPSYIIRVRPNDRYIGYLNTYTGKE